METIVILGLLGKNWSEVRNESNERIVFTLDTGGQYELYHDQDCCESVLIDDIVGELTDLVGTPLLMAEENSSRENPPGVTKKYQESFTWTFYNFATVKGHVTIRWYGESNGYYSESVSFSRISASSI